MGTYCGLRFKDVVIEPNGNDELERWLMLSTYSDGDKKNLSQGVLNTLAPTAMDNYPGINTMPNTVYTDFNNIIEKVDNTLILNIVISSKGLTNEFEFLFLYLKNYIKSGTIYHTHESHCRKVDLKGNVTCDMDPSDVMYYYLPYINEEDITSEELFEMDNLTMFGEEV